MEEIKNNEENERIKRVKKEEKKEKKKVRDDTEELDGFLDDGLDDL